MDGYGWTPARVRQATDPQASVAGPPASSRSGRTLASATGPHGSYSPAICRRGAALTTRALLAGRRRHPTNNADLPTGCLLNFGWKIVQRRRRMICHDWGRPSRLSFYCPSSCYVRSGRQCEPTSHGGEPTTITGHLLILLHVLMPMCKCLEAAVPQPPPAPRSLSVGNSPAVDMGESGLVLVPLGV
jgi:hypothetical protein